jgi:hypothetical protein
MAEREKYAVVELKVRVKEPLRDRIEAAARDRGVSMNAEVISRLEKSFALENDVADAFGGKQLFSFMQSISAAMRQAGEIATKSTDFDHIVTCPPWLTEPHAFDHAAKAGRMVIEAFRPPADASPSPAFPARSAEASLHERNTLIDAIVERLMPRMKRAPIPDHTLIPRDAADPTDGEQHDGKHHPPGQVQLASKIRGRRARRPNR